MACRTMQELLERGEGARVAVAGRYERWAPGPHPPDREPDTARLVLSDGTGVLIGRYGSAECIRPAAELEGLVGREVSIEGTFLQTLPWSGEGPPPGMWTGGGPQVVDVAGGPRPRTPEAPEAPAEPPPASPRPVQGQLIQIPPKRPPPPVPTPRGRVRRALVFGPSRWIRVATAVLSLVPAAVITAAIFAFSAPSWLILVPLLVFVAIEIALEALLQHLLIESALERVRRLRIPLDLAAYLKWLDDDPRGARPRVRLRLESSAPPDLRDELSRGLPWDLRSEWWGSDSLVLTGRAMMTAGPKDKYGHTLISASTVPVHRWFLRRVVGPAERLHEVCGIREISFDYGQW